MSKASPKEQPILNVQVVAEKTCPSCQKTFVKFLTMSKQKHCPHCHISLHVVKRTGEVVLTADRDCAGRLVSMIAGHISKRNDVVFDFEKSEYAAQLVHAYALVTRSKNFIKAQPNAYDISPYELVEEALSELLSSDYYRITTSLLFVRNQIAPIVQRLFKEKRRKEKLRRAEYVRLGNIHIGKENLESDHFDIL